MVVCAGSWRHYKLFYWRERSTCSVNASLHTKSLSRYLNLAFGISKHYRSESHGLTENCATPSIFHVEIWIFSTNSQLKYEGLPSKPNFWFSPWGFPMKTQIFRIFFNANFSIFWFSAVLNTFRRQIQKVGWRRPL